MKAKNIFLIFFLLLNFLNANDIKSQQDLAQEKMFLDKNDEVIERQCIPTCRKVNNNFIALVVDFDPKSGMTYCDIYDKNDLSNPTGIMANTKNKFCREMTNKKVSPKTLLSYGKGYDNASSLAYKPNNVTLTKFLAGLVTLDPELIDFKTTEATGRLTLKDPTAVYGTNTTDITGDDMLIATTDNLNKSNLAYYSMLYENMSNVYTALQYILLVCVGGWFFGVLGIKKLNERIEKANNQGRVLNTFLVPVIAFATFFMPIPESSGMNGTIIQKLIRASANISNDFADRVGTIGAEAYMQKLYSSVGAFSIEGEKILREDALNLPTIKLSYELALDECKKRYPNIASFMQESHSTDFFNVNGKDEKYTYLGCQNIEHSLQSYQSLERQNKLYLGALEKSIKNNKLDTLLKQINDSVNKRENELGWINSTIIPAMNVLVQNISLIEDNDIALQIQEDNKKITEQTSKEKATSNSENRKEMGRGEAQEEIALIMGNLAYLILPGAGEILNVIKEFFTSWGGNIPILKGFLNASGTIAGIGTIMIMYNQILQYIPLTVSIVASALAFLGYIIELAKFFYITPFVTAFSLTAGRQNKITEFLVTGITIFIKPILIVIFIYFALFIYGLFTDIFMIYSLEQLGMMRELQNQTILTMVMGIFSTLLKIVGAIGATYIMWKIILTAPNWVMKMIGLNDSGANNMVEQLSRNLERYSLQV
ncbi:hypothetical protein [Campylobacter corcagiensis]|uniref:DotA/TraY family protein n=1 Tax=Campylobacter corcagiensis TaxID=1448857 RepID=A0A6M8MXR4_9BACT|nr:hypothetical protein [Campylobacter corcagiensis]QKF65570.1 hypothetical protein CCORG_a0034 [Campylobacter corcagiensis]QOQ86522.1 hypothetical protein IMC76_00065 [Campylobacter corcagiensis]